MKSAGRHLPNPFTRLTTEHLWAITVIVGIFVFVNTHPIRPHDFWWHIALGREISATGRIPNVDTYSFTAAGSLYPSYKAFWLMDVFLYQIYDVGGPALIVFAQSLLITGAYAVLLWLGHRSTGNWRVAAFSILFAGALGINDWNVRPQAVTFIIAASYLLAIHEYRRTPRPGWLLIFPFGMMIWVNSHGTFPLGLLLIGFWLLDESWHAILIWPSQTRVAIKRLRVPAAVLAGTALTCLVSPQGLRVFSYVSDMSANPVIRNMVPEWAPATFQSLTGTLFLLGLLLSAILLALSPKRPSPFQILCFGAFAYLGLSTVRGAIWFGITMAPIIAEHLTELVSSSRTWLVNRFGLHFGSPPRPNLPLNAFFSGVLLVGTLVTLPWLKPWLPLPEPKAGLISSETPVQATEALLQIRPPGPVFHAMSYGSYLAWAAQPHYPVFVDSRIELYAPEVWFDYLNISGARSGWETQLAKYGIQTLFLSRQEQPTLISAVDGSDDWVLLYSDSGSRIYTARHD